MRGDEGGVLCETTEAYEPVGLPPRLNAPIVCARDGG